MHTRLRSYITNTNVRTRARDIHRPRVLPHKHEHTSTHTDRCEDVVADVFGRSREDLALEQVHVFAEVAGDHTRPLVELLGGHVGGWPSAWKLKPMC